MFNNYICSEQKEDLVDLGASLRQAIIYYGDFGAFAVQGPTTARPMSDEDWQKVGEIPEIPKSCWTEYCDYRP